MQSLVKKNIIITILLLFLSSPVYAINPNQVTLEWDPVTDPALAGYRVHGGTSSGNYGLFSMDVGNWTSCIAGDLKDNQAYYFAVTAYSIYGEESDYSNEVCISCVPSVQYSWNMDSNPGWSTGGLWAWGQPTGSGGQYGGADPAGGYNGSNIYGYNLYGDYENGLSETHLTSTAINCANLSGVTLKFQRWLNVEQPKYDHAYIRVSNNGISWTTIWENTAEVTDSSWIPQEFDISTVADGKATVYVRWTIGTTDGSWQYSGWNIDDVEIWAVGGVEPTCDDGIKNQGEDLIDCGGPCFPCDCLVDGDCTDGLFCNGTETCDDYGECQASSDPCPGQFCDEDNDECIECYSDGDCDDNLFCNGAETCEGGSCQAGSDPCPGQNCDESNDQCLTDPVEETVGNTLVFSQVTTTGNRRAMQYTMPESGTIQSITMYHQGGSGDVLLGIYAGSEFPDSRIAVTTSTLINVSAGWQTVELLAPVYVEAGQKIWLAWVFENNPEIHYQSGSPGRAHSSQRWGGGMPELFGSSSTTNYIYSIYADYITGTPSEYQITAVADPGGTIDPSGVITKAPSEDQQFEATSEPDYEVDQWYLDDVPVQEGGTGYTLSDIQANHTVRVTFLFTGGGHTGTVGNTLVFSQVSTAGNRRGMPYTMPESGTIQSITMYHQGGSGDVLLGIYEGSEFPDSRIAVTASTPINVSAGWQTVELLAPVYVEEGERIWLAWVFEQNPGIRYQSGSPGRAQSSRVWANGMPETFGSSVTRTYIYSIYADYISGP